MTPLLLRDFGPDVLVLIVQGEPPFMVTVTGVRKQQVIDAYQRAGLQIQIVSEQKAAS